MDQINFDNYDTNGYYDEMYENGDHIGKVFISLFLNI